MSVKSYNSLACRFSSRAVAADTSVVISEAEQSAVDLSVQNVPLLYADSNDQASVDSVVSQAKVVIACNGPYAQLGTPVVDACVRLGTHYVDITGVLSFTNLYSCSVHRIS